MQTRNEYKKHLETQLLKWDTQIDMLAARTRDAPLDVRASQAQELDELRMMQREASEKMIELEHANDNTWQKIKINADHLWHDLRISVAGAISLFRR